MLIIISIIIMNDNLNSAINTRVLLVCLHVSQAKQLHRNCSLSASWSCFGESEAWYLFAIRLVVLLRPR